MKGSLVELKGHSLNGTGIVMTIPQQVSAYSHDFLDGYRRHLGSDTLPSDHIIYRPEDSEPRQTQLMVDVYWPKQHLTTRHRLYELDFLRLVE